ncbi:hypothetical protein KY290_032498 [Solanum tuberosum]|uniref:DUF4283 domain-containing protein n=1 Tax=Solanum tuberosum TaxID=4113 RepID=A0ABQ7UC96_SOLTU|nr:hypothetical protein KY284_031933 [Solanum tuberosum]KAH0654217.1 hypothetical protein KY289_031895 [Solanum tuberosum]KAH0656840.1 hypothetical protein KY285_031722 [Solanum tuberosum]KAH0744505.1 hypothetical protein KY290_032498 [Solanum tuberosum]
MYEPNPSTPEGVTTISEEKSGKSKGETVREEHWPELPQHKGTGGSNNQLHEMNGTVAMERSAIKLSMPEKTPEKPWANLFATNRMAARGMHLTYIAPIIVDGEKIVEILAEDVAEDDVKWKPSVVVNVVGTSPSIGAMERFILSQGNFSSKPVVLYHADGYFVVRFANEEERDIVLCSGPHYLLRRLIIMKPWDPNFNFKEEILTTIPLWVKLPILPLNCWNYVVLSKIGSSLGKPLYADESKTGAPPPKKGQGQGQRKEWKPTTKEGKEPDKENDQQITTTNESQDQEEWQTVRRRATKKGIMQPEHTRQEDNTHNEDITWNVRGFNQEVKHKELRLFIRRNKVSIIAIFEHRVREEKAWSNINKIMPGWEWCTNATTEFRGRIWVVWNPSIVKFTRMETSVQCIHGMVGMQQSGVNFQFTAVYGLHNIVTRSSLWEKHQRIDPLGVKYSWQKAKNSKIV